MIGVLVFWLTCHADPAWPLAKRLGATCEHVNAARYAESRHITAEMLLRISWHESRFDACAVSRVEYGARKMGVRCSRVRPHGLGRSLFCGITQATATGWNDCLALRDTRLAYRRTVAELELWRRQRVCRDFNDPNYCAVLGYGGGWAAIKRNQLRGYPEFVLRKTVPTGRSL